MTGEIKLSRVPRTRAPFPPYLLEYDDDASGHRTLAFKLALLGLTDEQLAAAFAGGDLDALREWYEAWPNFRDEVQKGRLQADAEIAASLFKRAKGYELLDRRKQYRFDKEGQEVLSSIEERVTHVPASVDAIELWLKTRQRELWPLKPLPINPDEGHVPGKPRATSDDVTDVLQRLRGIAARGRDAEPKPQGDDPGGEDPDGLVD